MYKSPVGKDSTAAYVYTLDCMSAIVVSRKNSARLVCSANSYKLCLYFRLNVFVLPAAKSHSFM